MNAATRDPKRAIKQQFLAMIKAQNEILKEESVARIEMQRQELEHRKKEIELMRESSHRREPTSNNSLFSVKHTYECPILGDGDNDVDHHMTEFAHYCRVACPNAHHLSADDRLRLFATTLRGAKKRTYDSIYQETNRTSQILADHAAVLELLVACLKADFHESKEGA